MEVVILVSVLAVTIASVPLNFTMFVAGVVLKLVPVIVTVAATTPAVGVKLTIVGGGVTESSLQQIRLEAIVAENKTRSNFLFIIILF